MMSTTRRRLELIDTAPDSATKLKEAVEEQSSPPKASASLKKTLRSAMKAKVGAVENDRRSR